MKALRKSHPFYQQVLNHFRKQYDDVVELTILKVTTDNQICGGEWVNSNGITCIADSVDAFKSVKVID